MNNIVITYNDKYYCQYGYKHIKTTIYLCILYILSIVL